jgi:hypothetical protein
VNRFYRPRTMGSQKPSITKMRKPTHTVPITRGQQVFFLIDGDRVGDRLQLLLMDNALSEAEQFSAAISTALGEIQNILTSAGAHISFIGGDEILGTMPESTASTTLLSEIQTKFQSITGCTLSIGVGLDPRGALESLQRAKLSGRNRIVGGSK